MPLYLEIVGTVSLTFVFVKCRLPTLIGFFISTFLVFLFCIISVIGDFLPLVTMLNALVVPVIILFVKTEQSLPRTFTVCFFCIRLFRPNQAIEICRILFITVFHQLVISDFGTLRHGVLACVHVRCALCRKKEIGESHNAIPNCSKDFISSLFLLLLFKFLRCWWGIRVQLPEQCFIATSTSRSSSVCRRCAILLCRSRRCSRGRGNRCIVPRMLLCPFLCSFRCISSAAGRTATQYFIQCCHSRRI